MSRRVVLRSQKSQSQKKFQEGVAGKDGGKTKKRRKKDGVETLLEVSRVEIEEVGTSNMAKRIAQTNDNKGP